MFGTLPFLLYIVLQVALFVFRILLLHSDRLSGHRLRIFYRVPAFLPVSLRFSDVSGHNPVVVLSIVFYGTLTGACHFLFENDRRFSYFQEDLVECI